MITGGGSVTFTVVSVFVCPQSPTLQLCDILQALSWGRGVTTDAMCPGGGLADPLWREETIKRCEREWANEAWNDYSWNWWIKQGWSLLLLRKLSPLLLHLFSPRPPVVLLLPNSVGVLLSYFFLKRVTILRRYYPPTSLAFLPFVKCDFKGRVWHLVWGEFCAWSECARGGYH